MATNFSPTYQGASTYADLAKKTNTTVKRAIKLITEESNWVRNFPKENIIVSVNEMRIVLQLTQPYGTAMIPDFGYEARTDTPAPTHGLLYMTQMNKRYAYSNFQQALTQKARAGYIEDQTKWLASNAITAMSRTIGLQFYGQSTGTIAVVNATGSASATQVIQLKNGYGSTLVPGTTNTTQQTYISGLVRTNEDIALIRSGSLVEFGRVTASPSATSGVGYIDVTFNSSITPTANDLVVFANAVIDNTIAGTDVNNWPVGLIEILTATSVHGVSSVSYPAWLPGYTSTTGQRAGFALVEAMQNGAYNATGMKIDRMVMSQGVRRDIIESQGSNRRYGGNEDFNIDGDLDSKNGVKYLTSQLAPPGMIIGWNSQMWSKLDLTDQPTDGDGRDIFSIDKVQDRSGVAASFDYFRAMICSARGAFVYATNLTES